MKLFFHNKFARNLLISLSGIVILSLLLWQIPERQAQHYSEYVQAKDFPLLANEYRKTFAQVIGGLFLLIGLYLSWRRIEAVERQVRLAEEGQITERFTRAIDQLGNEKLEIRLGGIYALERISKDSKKDHWTVMEVLTAFIRENARWKFDDVEAQEAHEEEEDTPTATPSPSPSPDVPARESAGLEPTKTDIQAALSVICRRSWVDSEVGTIDLRRTDLRSYDLSGGILDKANFEGSHLDYAILRDARLKRAKLWNAHLNRVRASKIDLEKADLDDTQCEEAILVDANLRKASLERANLQRARMWRADISGANLATADLQRARLKNACLDDASLDEADLRRANAVKASMKNANLSFAKLDQTQFAETDFSGADLTGASLDGAKFHRAVLVGTRLQGTDLRFVRGLTKEMVASAETDDETQLPDLNKGPD